MWQRTSRPLCRSGIDRIFLFLFLVPAASEIAVTARSQNGQSDFGQSEWQRNLFERVSQTAAALSSAAEKPLLAHIDQPDFRAALAKCCPSISDVSAIELLKRLQAEARVSEVVTGFPSTSGSSWWWDPTLAEAYTQSFFENQWQVRVHHHGSFDGSGWFGTQDDVETKIYGFRPFSKRGRPANFSEASERGPYCAVNMLRVDAGSPLYGDISLVFSPKRMRDIALLSAVDTGSFEGMCNSSKLRSPWEPIKLGSPWGPLEHNCSAFPWGPSHLGTMEHFSHLLLINELYWNVSGFSPLLSRFARIVAKPESELNGWGKGHELRGMDFIHYLEAIPAGALRYPQDVKFVIGKFPRLFGTVEGMALQQWCLKRGWLLVWSLGLNTDNPEQLNFFTAPYLKGSFASNNRLLDPKVAHGSSVNVSASLLAEATAHFDKIWLDAQRVRAVANLENTTVNGSSWHSLYHELNSFVTSELQLEPLRAGSCEDEERCIGTNGHGRCVCFAGGESAPEKNMLKVVDTTISI